MTDAFNREVSVGEEVIALLQIRTGSSTVRAIPVWATIIRTTDKRAEIEVNQAYKYGLLEHELKYANKLLGCTQIIKAKRGSE